MDTQNVSSILRGSVVLAYTRYLVTNIVFVVATY